jgi:hypothetical protein
MNLNQACIRLVASLHKYRLPSVRAEKLWGAFHKFSLQEGLDICRQCDSAINLNGGDIFWQLVMEKVLLSRFMNYETVAVPTPTNVASERTLSLVEENAICYTAGYIVKKLISKYSRSSSPRAAAYLDLLKRMGCKLAEKTPCGTPDRSSHCSKWTEIVDRGGLLHVSNTVYDLFMFLEYTVDEELTSIFKAKGKGIERVRREKLDWLCGSDEVQIVWSMITDAVEDEDSFHDLLVEIASMWITTRGHSKACRVKEELKRAKDTGMKGKHSLRKELKQKNDNCK